MIFAGGFLFEFALIRLRRLRDFFSFRPGLPPPGKYYNFRGLNRN